MPAMKVSYYVVGLLLSVVSITPIVAGSIRLRARLVPAWFGAPARLAEAIIAAGLIVVALELAGVSEAFDRTGAVLACVLAGLATWLGTGLISRPARDAESPARRSLTSLPRAYSAVAVTMIAAVSAAWLGWTIYTYRHGMATVDTLWYHLPLAARFIQAGSILHLQYFDSSPVTVFYPANSELFHALGLLLFRSDVISPAINLGWGALALTAGWAIGRPFQRAPHCLIAVLLILATPGLIDTQPGGAYNDVVCVALLLSSSALLVNGGVDLPASALAAVAAGLALGTKFTMIAPTLALGAGVIALSARGTRWRQAGIWGAGLLVAGGYWYIRNAAVVGNPLPSLAIHVGPLSLPAPHVSTPTFTVGQYLTNVNVWRGFFVPGLRQSLGLAWWSILLLSAFGALGLLLAGRGRVERLLGAVAVVSAGAFVISPQFLGLPGAPIFFVANVRYAATPIALGLVLVPLVPPLRNPWHGAVWLALAALILAATELDPGVWPTGVALKPFAHPIRGGAAIAGIVAGLGVLAIGLAWVLGRGRVSAARAVHARSRLLVTALAGSLLMLATVGGWALANTYSHRRYQATQPLPTIYAWAQHVRNSRIGIVWLTEQYPFYGPDSSNYVQYLGAPEPHAGFGPISSCRSWRRTVDSGHYDWLVVAPNGFPLGQLKVAQEVAWTASSGSARVVMSETAKVGASRQTVVLFHLSGPLDPSACFAQPSTSRPGGRTLVRQPLLGTLRGRRPLRRPPRRSARATAARLHRA